ncbi:uncharacterized protein LOC122957394 [Acropora millepora]|uniref:uncharacterized protein LOC122957394 n=1 Tax=Acropora millepora TaxID=45264 RepID=UPI001CF55A43|nr:uncharacterized protein LOC122957394 [Acropora millepora]
MGGNESKSHSRRKPTTSTGLLGRGRHTKYYTIIPVAEINGRTIGREIIKRCGHEGHHPDLGGKDKATLRFLRAANSFIHDALDDGADMRNTAFILRQPCREIVLKSGNGDWEYDFCEDCDGDIYGRCIRQPLLRYAYNTAKKKVQRIFGFAFSSVRNLLGGGVLALR